MKQMMQDPKPTANPDQPAEPGELHHGDLRKAAYLKRRADYQMQANAPATSQAGTLGSNLPRNNGRRSG
ncbi:MAG: hypothetical protein LJE59_16325 [Chromatiaceae bacterium]|jgi:hypothetical protein|nr:hypothetical protein [Chromatiaceae bacterium]